MFALNLAGDGRILSATYEQYAIEGQPIVETLPDGDISDFIYYNGEYNYSPIPKPSPPQDVTLSIYDELEAAYNEGVNSI